MMWLKNISLLNFKNYSGAELDFNQGINVFVGNNGAGKTNILDAIHYLCLSKSYFNPIDSQQIKSEQDFFMIQGKFDKSQHEEIISCGLKRNQKKSFKRNKKEYQKLAEHIGLFPLVMITPYDINLILDGSEERRKFIDNTISQTDSQYLEQLILYNKFLLNRNTLFKQIANGAALDMSLLEIFNAQLIEVGNFIFEKRQTFLKDFIPLFDKYYSLLSDNAETVSLSYQSQLKDASFAQLLEKFYERDRVLERTTVGIHKDELLFEIAGMSLKKFGSQGQQKSFLIALKLAQYNYLFQFKGFKPLLLLDDIFDKLDQQRIKKLMEMVSHDDFGQLFITDTHTERVTQIFNEINKEIKLFEIKEGEVIYA